MKKFLRKISYFVSVLAIGYLSVFFLVFMTFKFVVTDFHKDKGNYANEYNAFFQKKDGEILILGSSRAAASLDAHLMTNELNLKSYNLAFTQSNITYSHHLLKYYLAQSNKKPQYIILDMSWFSFDKNRLGYKDYASYFAFNDLNTFREEFFSTRTSYIPMGLITIIRSLTRESDDYFDFLSSRSIKNPEQNENKKSYEFLPNDDGFLKTFPAGKSQIDTFEVASYKKIIELAEANGIKIILYTSPEDELFSKSQKNRAEVYEIISENCTNCLVLDYSLHGNQYAKDFELLLGDSHHIYFRELFTSYFIKDLKKSIGLD
ncbi:hypothetical protein [Cellulophaga sp. Hel_I_12]|uniref:hypothetical protein n=1 Tax=Cellulophaga sp. Hel_I_12 TaxID=1249972 RepID=UPI000646F5E8|nr:hypothetical protein [Cellulophaga sp. Hel_I_12]